ncbi:MAG TPA: cation:proton antiporter, partial [Myxococcota bacterium]|nr:cation:proton antiporter [Myxococcota bacterium]
MDPVQQALITIAAIFTVGAIGEAVFRRTGLPDVVWLIGVGVLIGPTFGLVSTQELMGIAPLFAAITLVIVLFEGGRQLRLEDLTKAAGRAVSLALLSFFASVLVVTGLVLLGIATGILPESWTYMHGLLLGAILGGSSSIIIMPAMALARMEPKVGNLVNLESAFTDVFCVVGATVLIALMAPEATTGEHPGLVLGRSFGLALGVGLVVGILGLLALPWLAESEHAYTYLLAGLLGLYALVDSLQASAALAILTCAVVLGNAPTIRKKFHATKAGLSFQVTTVHTQLTFIIKSFFFTFIGAMLGPPWPIFALGLGFGLALLFARWMAVHVAWLGSGLGPERRTVVLVSMPRGLAAGVLCV